MLIAQIDLLFNEAIEAAAAADEIDTMHRLLGEKLAIKRSLDGLTGAALLRQALIAYNFVMAS